MWPERACAARIDLAAWGRNERGKTMKRYIMSVGAGVCGNGILDPAEDRTGIGVEAKTPQDALKVGLAALAKAGRLVTGYALARVKEATDNGPGVFVVHAFTLNLKAA